VVVLNSKVFHREGQQYCSVTVRGRP